MNNFASKYFERVKTHNQSIFSTPPLDLEIIVVIPVFNEPEVDKTLQSIISNNFSGFSAELIFVINSAENTTQNIKKTNISSITKLQNTFKSNNNKNLSIEIIHFPNLPIKKSGVGVARKIGMDEALRQFASLNKPKGIIVSLDADTIVEKNYLQEIFNFFSKNEKIHAANIKFEHPISGKKFSEEIYSAITVYEIYLRYYIEALKFTGFPYAFHTIGSAFCCKARIYSEQGGMVTNQSGEDFYFLQKIIPVSNFAEIKSTTVFPSPRITDRVIFGTGVAVEQIIHEYNFDFPTYQFDAFKILKDFFDKINLLFESSIHYENLETHKILKDFLRKNQFDKKILEIKNNTKDFINFKKRFFNWFNAFRVIKFLNFSHENHFQKSSTIKEAIKLLEIKNIKSSFKTNNLLELYRKQN